MSDSGWSPPQPPADRERRSLVAVAAPVVLFFDVAGLIVLIHYDQVDSVVEAAASLVLTGPLVGAILLLGPVSILASHVRSWAWIAMSELLMAPVIVAVLVLVEVEGREHSTAGIGLIYIPILCSAIALLATLGDRLQARRG